MSAQTIQLSQDLIEALNTFKKSTWGKTLRHRSGLSRMEFILLHHIRMHCEEQKNGTGYGYTDPNTDQGVSPSTLRKHLHISPPTITQHMTSLEKKGCIERRIDTEDRRAIRVVITSTGWDKLKIAEKEHQKVVRGLVEKLGESSSRQLINLLNTCSEYLNNLEESESC